MIYRKKISLSGTEFDKVDVSKLFVEIFPRQRIENSFISDWNENRKKEFLLGRELVSGLIMDAGDYGSDLVRREDGRCSWPDGISGSISHTLNRKNHTFNCIGIIGTEKELIGIDIESILRFEKLDPKTFINDEEEKIRHKEMEKKEFYSIIFSSKESIYKAIYPLYLKYFGFESATLQDLSRISNTKFISKYLLSEHITKKLGYSVIEVISNISENLVTSELIIKN